MNGNGSKVSSLGRKGMGPTLAVIEGIEMVKGKSNFEVWSFDQDMRA